MAVFAFREFKRSNPRSNRRMKEFRVVFRIMLFKFVGSSVVWLPLRRMKELVSKLLIRIISSKVIKKVPSFISRSNDTKLGEVVSSVNKNTLIAVWLEVEITGTPVVSEMAPSRKLIKVVNWETARESIRCNSNKSESDNVIVTVENSIGEASEPCSV